MIKIIGYTTHGNVREQCGHLHATEADAERCLYGDRIGCARPTTGAVGGYSDRRVVIVGEDGYLYASEGVEDGTVDEESWVPGIGGRTNGGAKFVGEVPAEK
ncbi:MAG: hypothetical protein KGJ86_06155 [Chloroflexota bacterium]|nr:hypothetical protein [Chloroflexota bacterium]